MSVGPVARVPEIDQFSYPQRVDSPDLDVDLIDVVGDAQILLTAPFFPSMDPLGFRPACTIPDNGTLDTAGRLVQSDRSMDHFLRGSLTFGNPHIDLLTHFKGSDSFNNELTTLVESAVDLQLEATVTGILFPDGHGSVAIRIIVPGGWNTDHRERLMDAFGPKGRDDVAGKVRDALLPALTEVADRCCPEAKSETVFPYFNLTYAGCTSHPRPGRAKLPDELRPLIYPRSPEPIESNSPWSDEFFYAGYAFSLLVSADPQRTLEQLEHLLLHLDVLYARMDRSAAAADQLIRGPSRDNDIDWLVTLERRLRADYQALVQPTFSYDHHVLRLRDSLLYAWETDKTRERTETLLQMARQAVERELAEQQARRVDRMNLIVTILTALSFVASAEAAVNLLARIF